MQLQQLAYFVEVAHPLHFTRAAENMGVSQPTLSKQIRVLENSVGTRLFSRHSSGIALTSAGEALLPHAQRMLINADSALRSVGEVAELKRGRVRLGATPSTLDGLLPPILMEFHQRHPGVEFEIHESGSRVLSEELHIGNIDIALLIVPVTTDDPSIETTVVYRERLLLASPASSDLPEEIDVTSLADLPLVMFREGYDLRDVTLRACATAGFEPRFSVEGGEMGSVLRLVEAGLGHAVVPDIALRNRHSLRTSLIVSPPLERHIAVAHREPAALPLSVQAFRSMLLERLAAPQD
ncbi:MAG: LysR family transcriptional regulator [Actinomycetales bacterium]|nr:LysR family transcriptional regulator [Actinomycetales bacterium]